MAARKWLIRLIFPLLVVGVVIAGLSIYAYMRPAYVRLQLIQYLQERFPNVDVEVGSAYLRLFGGISVGDVRLTLKDDPTRIPFLIVPSAVLAHDKEAFQNGQLILRKIELKGPQFRLERFANKKWNIETLLQTINEDSGPPTVVAKQASLQFVDHQLGSAPFFETNETDLVILNDPQTIYSTEVQVKSSSIGAFSLQGRWDTELGDWFGTFDFKGFAFGPQLIRMVSQVAPEASKHLTAIEGNATAQLKLSYENGPKPELKHDLKLSLLGGRLKHPEVPIVLEDLAVEAHLTNGHLIVDKAVGRSGQAKVTLSLDLPWKQTKIEVPSKEPVKLSPKVNRFRRSGFEYCLMNSNREGKCSPLLLQTLFEHIQHQELPPMPMGEALKHVNIPSTDNPEFLEQLEARLHRLDVAVTNLKLSPELFKRLPHKLQHIHQLFKPEGAISLKLDFQRRGEEWTKICSIIPEGFTATYEDYPYPVRNIRGTLEQVFSSNRADRLTVNLTGIAADREVTIKGFVEGEDPEMNMDLHIAASGLPIDHRELIDALPKPYPQLVKKLHPSGKGDLRIHIRQNDDVRRLYGPEEFDNQFWFTIIDGQFNYEEFPYPLQQVNGTVYIRTQPLHPTRLPPAPELKPVPATAAPDVSFIELQNFTASHHRSKLKFTGRKEPTTGGAVLTMQIKGDWIEFDQELYNALARLQLADVLKTFSPRGRMNCELQARLFHRAETFQSNEKSSFNPSEDLEMNFAFSGPGIQPIFLPYLLTDVSGRLAYARNRVELFDLKARHRETQVSLPKSEVIMKSEGGFWADLKDLIVNPIVFDADLLSALPPGLRSACETLALKGPIGWHATRMVIDERASPPRPRFLPPPEGSPNKLVRGYRPNESSVPQPDPVPYSSDGESTPSKNARPILPTIYWDGKLVFENASFQTGIKWEEVNGTFATRGLFDADRLDRVISNLALDRAIISKQPIQDLIARFEVDPQEPDILKVPMLRGSLYGGEVGGEARLVLQDNPRYELKLNATRIRLEELAKQQQFGPKAQMEGLATAQLYLHNRLDEKKGQLIRQGGGSIDVPNGKLLNLPHILDLLKVLKGKPPDETAFEEAKILFRIRGDRVLINQLDLMGNAISLGGQGEMNIDGSNMALEFYTVWTRVNNLLASPLSDVTAMFSKAFFKVVVKGELGGKTEIKKEPVPFIVDPIRRVMNRVRSGIGMSGSTYWDSSSGNHSNLRTGNLNSIPQPNPTSSMIPIPESPYSIPAPR